MPAKKTPEPKQTVESVMVATEPLSIDGVPAFNPGDPVPAEHVQRNGWEDKVKPVVQEKPKKDDPLPELPQAGHMLADEPLFVDGVRAFNPGDRVPVEHVARFGWHHKVRNPDG